MHIFKFVYEYSNKILKYNNFKAYLSKKMQQNETKQKE